MKKSIFLFVSMLVLGLTISCSSDDDGDNTGGDGSGNTEITGKWIYDKIGYFDDNGNEELYNYPHTSGCDKDYIELKSNGVLKEVNYFKEGNNCVSNVISDGQWSKNGNSFTISYENGEVLFMQGTILSPEGSSTLKIKFHIEDEESPMNGVEQIMILVRS